MSRLLIAQYYQEIDRMIRYGGSKHESQISVPFYNLLNSYCQSRNLMAIPQLRYESKKPDGTIKDALRSDWGYWESKDQYDNLDLEIENKIGLGYPTDNILFEDSQTAVLIQQGKEILRVSMKEEDALDQILNAFLNYTKPEIEEFHKAIEEFKLNLPDILVFLRELIDQQTKSNDIFKRKRQQFLALCQESINPEITDLDIREMMIQHILSEDIFINIFNDAQFHRDNNIAKELQGVIDTFFTRTLKQNTFKSIEHYYATIRKRAAEIADHHEKQWFLKLVYENFYKAYNPKAADRLGIVYTPSEIVKFMIESVDSLTHKHFNKFLSDKGVEILDPATGTGTFITELIEYLDPKNLEYKYKHEIHCNEVAILPYYIANLNIEYTYQKKMGEYIEFEHICFMDTLKQGRLSERQLSFLVTDENTKRIQDQNSKTISVIIGNPPYNAKQENFSQNNANWKYKRIDQYIKESYVKQGTAQNQIVLYDMYVRFICWATDRLSNNGILAFVTNSSFIDGLTFDGFRKVVSQEFSEIYVIDLGGNMRGGDKTGNIFGIKIGVAISFMIKKETNNKLPCQIRYYRLPSQTVSDKLKFLSDSKIEQLPFDHIIPDKRHNWINLSDNDFDGLLPLMDKEVKAEKSETAVFKLFSSGLKSQRDEWVYDLSRENLEAKMKYFIEVYQETLQDENCPDRETIKWDSDLTKYLERRIDKKFDKGQIVSGLYRPYRREHLYFDKHFNGRTYQWFEIFNPSDKDNRIIVFITGKRIPFVSLVTDTIADLNFYGLEPIQCFPLYTYDKNGNRIDNITDWGLQQFREYYNTVEQASSLSKSSSDRQDACDTINKEDIFYYTYAVLHNPEYRQKYELNLKRDFPRIPFYDNFWQWVEWGQKLMDLHINYETVKPYSLKRIDIDPPQPPLKRGEKGEDISLKRGENQENICLKRGEKREEKVSPLSRGTEGGSPQKKPKVKLKADKIKHQIIIDDITTLTEIPPIAWNYKLGNRSALEWILDQYKEKKPKDPTIAEKFNTYRFADYKKQVIDLLMRVCAVSVETMQIIEEMTKK